MPEISGDPVQLGKLAVVQQRDDEQHGVGAHDAGVIDVAGRDLKSLRSTGSPTAARAISRSSGLPPK